MPPSTILSPNLHRKPIQIKRRYVIVLVLLFVFGYAYIYVWTSRTRDTFLVETGNPKSESSLNAITNMSGFDTPYVWSGSKNRSDRKALKKLTDSCNPNPRKSLRVKEFSSFHSLVKTLPPISMLDKRCVSVIEADRDGWSLYDEHLCRHRFIFVSGLHHSGTSLTNYLLQTHDDISGHMDTGAGQDEGVQLQKEYPSAMNYGGACNFLFNKEIYLNSDHETANTKTRRCVMAQWSKNWDLSKEILLEKSPPTLVQLEYRDYLFPYVSAHIIVVRHPLYMCFVKTLSDDLKANWPLKGRAKKKLRKAIDGWLRAHEFLSLQSVPSVTSKVAILQYETYFNKTDSVDNLLQLPSLFFPEISKTKTSTQNNHRHLEYRSKGTGAYKEKPKVDAAYLSSWIDAWNDVIHNHKDAYEVEILPILQEYEVRVNKFGYSLVNISNFDAVDFQNGFGLNENSVYIKV